MAHFFINRPVFAWVIAIIITLSGVYLTFYVPVSEYPDIAPIKIMISAQYNGASAETVEKSVTKIIEDSLDNLEHLIYMESSSTANKATVTLTFDNSTNPNTAQVEVQNKIQLIESKLPETVRTEGVTVTRSSSSILLVAALVSTNNKYSTAELGNIVKTTIKDPIKRLSGIGDVSIFGSGYAMRIWLDPFKLKKYNLTPLDVITAIKNQNTQVSVGSLGGQPTTKEQQITVTIVAQSQLTQISDFESIILKTNTDGSFVKLANVARIEIGQETYGNNSFYNGRPASGFAVNLASGANAVSTANNVLSTLSSLAKSLPEGTKVEIPYDTTPFIRSSIKNTLETLIEAIVLVFVIMLIFLQNIRATIIPTITIPVVLMGTLATLSIAGYSINLLTMFAMVLAIGLLVDDAIVVVENVERVMREENLSPKEATKKSMSEITNAIIGIALVLSAVFLPMGFLSGSIGIIYRQFSITLISSMLLSAIVALVLTPALCASILKPANEVSENKFFHLFNKIFEKINLKYISFVSNTFKHPLKMIVVFMIICVMCLWIFKRIPSSFIPQEDKGSLMTIIQTPENATAYRTENILKKVQEYYINLPDVNSVFGVLGFSFAGSKQNHAMLFNKLKDCFTCRLTAQLIAQHAMQYFSSIRDAKIFAVLPPEINGLGNSGGFSMYLVDNKNQGQEALIQTAKTLIQTASKTGKVMSLRLQNGEAESQMKIILDQEKIGAMNVNIADVNSMLTTIFSGTYVNDFTYNNNRQPVIVQADSSWRMQPNQLGFWWVRNTNKEMVPFSSFSKIKWIKGFAKLSRFNGTTAIKIDGSAANGVSNGTAMNEIENIVSSIPGGYSIEWEGISYQEKLSGSQSLFLYMLSILVVFLCLAALYESWSIPFSVLLAIPISIFGALGAAMITNQSNDIYFKVSLLITIGLAAKNAILIVEFAKERTNKGMNVIAATLEASKLRLRPIIMTSMAFIFGTLPLTLATGASSAAQHSVGIGVIGGIILSTFVGILFVPYFFVFINQISNLIKSLIKRI
ncbi:RND efflux system, inner membrane transporter CmeB [Liberibacter crescens BT-1]|uniref:Efflux pump membrane transporter n=1 Tax=Liberibacter crescens (strain BT-1) TaxID=1215343 RepID=L0ETW2_LIBCB|nr:multidrug efflux RND transporter permease subunit [Liberibacter crescens]AGA64979.1 RND efflux system, inner membrane transporter CmeB [Liberibacter crescens BT-1]AMC12998.1 multidrug transporter [Liberibacter crescens]